MQTRAKFRCDAVTVTQDGITAFLSPVTHGSVENEQFYRYTPRGQIEIGVVNATTAALFEPGREYYVDFTPAGA